MSNSTRHSAREVALQALYAADTGESDSLACLSSLAAEAGLSEKHLAFARELLQLTLLHVDGTDSIIGELSENWRIERVALIDRLILRLALTELKYRPDTPEKVVVNEAIELAKTFSTGQSYQFVNGILDRVLKDQQAEGQSVPEAPSSDSIGEK